MLITGVDIPFGEHLTPPQISARSAMHATARNIGKMTRGDFGKYLVHPAADEFPLLDDERMNELVESVRSRGGLINPIVLLPDGKTIVEGRNRYLACIKAGIEPKFKTLSLSTTETEIINFISDCNLQRRDLLAGQRAVIILKLERRKAELLAAEAKQRQRLSLGRGKKGGPTLGRVKDDSGRVNRKLAKDAGVSHGTIAKANKVLSFSKRLSNDVAHGKTSLDDAYREARASDKSNAIAKEQTLSNTHVMLPTHEGKQISYPLPKAKPTFNRTNQQVDWSAWTWNPVTGCLHGCKYCYAREMAEMRESYRDAYPVGFTPLFHHERLDAPINTVIPGEAKTDSRLRRVFVCSMADLFGQWVPDQWIEQVLASCNKNLGWEYLFLTKFPRRYVGLQLPQTAWIGTSVDEQKRVRLAEDAFRQIKDVRVKWLSLEPLLAPLEFTDLSMFDWVVIGSQSATEQPSGRVPAFAPPFEWVARLTNQAHEAGCKVYQKPNLLGEPSSQSPGMKLIQEEPPMRNGATLEKAPQLVFEGEK